MQSLPRQFFPVVSGSPSTDRMNSHNSIEISDKEDFLLRYISPLYREPIYVTKSSNMVPANQDMILFLSASHTSDFFIWIPDEKNSEVYVVLLTSVNKFHTDILEARYFHLFRHIQTFDDDDWGGRIGSIDIFEDQFRYIFGSGQFMENTVIRYYTSRYVFLEHLSPQNVA